MILGELTVLEWAVERLDNSVRIAPSKTIDDADLPRWFEDIAYWRLIVGALRVHGGSVKPDVIAEIGRIAGETVQ